MQFATINDVTLHYQEIGAPPDKPALVFVNALGTDFRIWRDMIVRFVGSFSILTYDKRGHGLSSVGTAPYTMDDHAADLAGLLDHTGRSQVIVIGLSVGGMIAQLLASKRPDLVRALVLCDTGAKIGNEALWNSRIETIEAKGMESVGEAAMERWFSQAFRNEHPDEIEGYRNMVVRQPQAGYLGTCAAIRDCDLTEIASTLPVPAACIVGEHDVATTPALVGELAKLLPEANYDVIKNSAHMPCIEQPVVMADLVKAFVADLTA